MTVEELREKALERRFGDIRETLRQVKQLLSERLDSTNAIIAVFYEKRKKYLRNCVSDDILQ